MSVVAAVFGVVVAVVIICLVTLVVVSILRAQRKAAEDLHVNIDMPSVVFMATPETAPSGHQALTITPVVGAANRGSSSNRRTKRKRRKNKLKDIENSFPAVTFEQVCRMHGICDAGRDELKSCASSSATTPLEVVVLEGKGVASALVDSGLDAAPHDQRHVTRINKAGRVGSVSDDEDGTTAGVCGASIDNLESDDQEELSFLAFGVSIKDEGSIKGCAVCLCSFSSTDVVRLLRCDHIFHKACIDGWLKRHNDCPLCKFCLFADGDAATSIAGPNNAADESGPTRTSTELHIRPWQRPGMFPGATNGYVPRNTVRHSPGYMARQTSSRLPSDRSSTLASRGRVRSLRSALGTVRQAIPQFWDRNRRNVPLNGTSGVMCGDEGNASTSLTVAGSTRDDTAPRSVVFGRGMMTAAHNEHHRQDSNRRIVGTGSAIIGGCL